MENYATVFWFGIIVLFIVNIPIYRALFKKFFVDMDDFQECLYYLFRFDLISFFKGELLEDMKKSMWVKLYFGICLAILFIETLVFLSIVEWAFQFQV